MDSEPWRVLDLLILFQAVCDAANGNTKALEWLKSAEVECMCEDFDIEPAALLRAVDKRAATPARERSRYVP